MKVAIKKRWVALGALLACLVGAPAAWADLVLTAQSVSAAPGDVNDTFDVYLTNIGGSAVDVSSFSFEINTSSSDIAFQQSTTATTTFSYIFAGNSLVGPVNSTDGPGQTLDVSDIAATPNSFTVVGVGDSFGLGHIFFDVAPGASPQVAPVDIKTDFALTSVTDEFGNPIALEFTDGAITVTSASTSTVPEPSPTMLLAAAVLGLVWMKRRSRRTA
jgi:hypothetical protein